MYPLLFSFLSDERDFNQLSRELTNHTAERDRLLVKYQNLTNERDQLQTNFKNAILELSKLGKTIGEASSHTDRLCIKYYEPQWAAFVKILLFVMGIAGVTRYHTSTISVKMCLNGSVLTRNVNFSLSKRLLWFLTKHKQTNGIPSSHGCHF